MLRAFLMYLSVCRLSLSISPPVASLKALDPTGRRSQPAWGRTRLRMAPKKKEEDTGPSLAARFGRVKSNLKMGIVGLPNVGKSSLFNLLTEQAVAAENYPFCTMEPTDARCSVPDARYDDLISVWKPKSEYPAYLWCTDIAASEGAGLGNAFLSHIQAVDGIYHVVRAFEDTEITHVDDTVDPVRDLET